MQIKSFGQFALALTLAAGLSTAAFAAETAQAPMTSPEQPAAHAMKTKEECEKLPTAERTACLKQVKETKAEATSHGKAHSTTHKE